MASLRGGFCGESWTQKGDSFKRGYPVSEKDRLYTVGKDVAVNMDTLPQTACQLLVR